MYTIAGISLKGLLSKTDTFLKIKDKNETVLGVQKQIVTKHACSSNKLNYNLIHSQYLFLSVNAVE